MTAEAPYTTTERFIGSWRNQHPDRLAAELFSLANETLRQPDNYFFHVATEGLIDPETNKPILDFIAPGVERDVALKLQEWATIRDKGSAYWLSPKKEGIYPCSKVIFHEIAYDQNGNKVVNNTAILFDGDFENPEEIRQTLFKTPEGESLADMISWIELISGQKINTNPQVNFEYKSQARRYAQMVRQGVNSHLIVSEMQATGFLGNNPVSCARNFSYMELNARTIIIGNPLRTESQNHFECPGCHGKIESGKGITTCPHCGLTKEQAGSKCD